MAWKPPTKGKKPSMLDKIPTGNYEDAWRFDYNKEISVGESVVFRILSLDEADITVTEVVTATVKKANGEPMEIKIPLPSDSMAANSIKDDAGNKLSDLDSSNLTCIPVFVLYSIDKKGRKKQDINRIAYIQVGPMILKQLRELQLDADEEGTGFGNDEVESPVPPYSLKLRVFKEGGFPKYELKPVRKVKGSDGASKKAQDFGLDNDEALADEWDDIVSKMGELVEHLKTKQDDETKPENVKKRFARYRKNQQESATSAKNNRKPSAEEDDDEDEDVEDEDEDDEDEAPKSKKASKKASTSKKKRPADDEDDEDEEDEEDDEDEDEEPVSKKSKKTSTSSKKRPADDEDEDDDEEDEEDEDDEDEDEEPASKKKASSNRFSKLSKPSSTKKKK